MPSLGHKHMAIDSRKHKCPHLCLHTTAERNATQQGMTGNSLDGVSQRSPSPSSCLPISLFLHERRWRLCQTGAQRPHKAREDVTTNKNSIVTPRNLIRSHWFMLWMETEYLESGSSNKAIDGTTGAFTIRLYSSLSFSSHLLDSARQLKDDTVITPLQRFESFLVRCINPTICLNHWFFTPPPSYLMCGVVFLSVH